MAATASRSSSGLPLPVMTASGSKPLDSGGTDCRSSSSTQPLGHAVVAGGVDLAHDRAKLVGPGNAGQEG